MASPMALFLLVGRRPAWQHGATEPRIESGEQARRAIERLDHGTIEDRIEESAFERDQEQPAAHALRPSESSAAALRQHGVPIAGFFQAVQIVEDIGRAQELEQSEARVP